LKTPSSGKLWRDVQQLIDRLADHIVSDWQSEITAKWQPFRNDRMTFVGSMFSRPGRRMTFSNGGSIRCANGPFMLVSVIYPACNFGCRKGPGSAFGKPDPFQNQEAPYRPMRRTRGKQSAINLLAESAAFASEAPGWLSASIHRSYDGTRVVNYAQSESAEAAEQIITRLRNGGWLERNKALGEAHPGLYEVVFTLDK
jgi:hypothetical protein